MMLENEQITRRYKIAYIDPQVIVQYLTMWETTDNVVNLRRLDGREVEGSVVVSASWSHERACIAVQLYHRDWEIVPMGRPIPEIPGLVPTIWVNRKLVPELPLYDPNAPVPA